MRLYLIGVSLLKATIWRKMQIMGTVDVCSIAVRSSINAMAILSEGSCSAANACQLSAAQHPSKS
jgi:hypothetical protein